MFWKFREYGFDGFFCIPGKEGAHEKGGVEGEIGRFRRRHLVPVPKVASLAELNELITLSDLLDEDRRDWGREADQVRTVVHPHSKILHAVDLPRQNGNE